MSEEITEELSEEEEIVGEDSSDDLTEAVEYDSWDEIVDEAIDDDVDINDAEAFGEWLDETYEDLYEEGDEDEEEDDEEEGDEEEGDEDEEEVPEGAGAKARKAARLAYKKLPAAEKKKRAKAGKISAKRRKGKKVIKRKKLKASFVPTTKNQMLKNIYDQVNGMLKGDLSTKYEEIMAATNLEIVKEEDKEVRTKVAVKVEDIKIDVKDDVEALIQGEEGLTEDFKQKASTIFEAAVQAKVVEQVNAKMEELETELKSDQDTSSEEFAKELTEKVDGYLTYIVEEWMKENELAIERGIRTELVEDFMSGLRTLFTEHYIDIPEEKVDMVDDLFTKVEDLETSLDEEINRGVELQKELAQFKKDDALKLATKDLADTDSEKISKLAEGIEFENTEQYIQKLNVLKESYFPKSDAVTSEITETDETIEVSDEKQEVRLDENMKHYTSAIKRYNS